MSTGLLQIVNSLLYTCWQLWTSSVNTTCWWQLLASCTRKNSQVVTGLQTNWCKSVRKLSASCVRTACSYVVATSLEQPVNNLLTVVSTSLIQPGHCKKQYCYITTASDLLEQQIVNSLLHTCWQRGASSANTTCCRLVDRLATSCEIFAFVPVFFAPQKRNPWYEVVILLCRFVTGILK